MVDVVILVLLAGGAWLGYQKGLVRSLVGLLGNVVALFLAYVMANPLAAALTARFGLEPMLAVKIQTVLPLPETLGASMANLDNVAALYSYLDKAFVPRVVQQSIVEAVQTQLHSVEQGVFMTMAETVAQAVAQAIWQGLVFAGLWFVLALVLLQGSRLLMGMVHHIPLVGKIDRLSGAAISLLLVALVVAMLYNTLGLFGQVGAPEQGTWQLAMSQSKVLPVLQSTLQSLIQ